ncbi:MAG: hypothetical protein HBSAPP03_30080 [Phycisphaerae bacterium]|nr:MAG: hypothetical protein HBSAPP03_30080 [Phycisphaerae bacterium]
MDRRILLGFMPGMTIAFISLGSRYILGTEPGWLLGGKVELLAFGLTLLLGVAPLVQMEQAYRRAEIRRWRACPTCLYDLSGIEKASGRLEGPWVCPECGSWYTLQELGEHWNRRGVALHDIEQERSARSPEAPPTSGGIRPTYGGEDSM